MGVRPTQLTENRKNRLAKLFRILICQLCRPDTHALEDIFVPLNQLGGKDINLPIMNYLKALKNLINICAQKI